MAVDDELAHTDAVLTIGVLARLSGCFMADVPANPDSFKDRYRRDLSSVLGHPASDEECHRFLESQVERLRLSIGERW